MNASLDISPKNACKLHKCRRLATVARLTQRRHRVIPSAGVTYTEAPEKLPSNEAAAWQECASRLQSLGMEPEKANIAVGKAFGWSGQAFWRQERVEDVPSIDEVEASLQFLQTLGISTEEDLASLINRFPECLGLDAGLMESNVDKLKKAFFMKGAALAGAVKRKPRVLGSTVDCQGNCQGECTRCFAQF